MSIDVKSVLDSLMTAIISAPAFTVLVVSFLIVGALESWRPFTAGKNEPDGRMLTNFGLGIINAAIQLVVPVSVLLAVGWAARNDIGLLNQTDGPFLMNEIAAVLIYSLASYWAHRLSHRVPTLWRMHHVHHADTHIDLSTGFRNHPAELIYVIVFLSAISVAAGLSPVALLAYQIASAAFSLWSHADLALPEWLDRKLRIVIVTPDMHRVHHSATQQETDSNYGEVFSFWDRLFGSYRHLTPDELRAMRIGLGDGHDAGAASLMKQLAAPARI